MQNQLLRKKSISNLFLLHCQMNPAVDSPEDESSFNAHVMKQFSSHVQINRVIVPAFLAVKI